MTNRPDIYVVVWDCARADRVSGFGYGRPTTPFLDRLIAEGHGFDHAYSAAVWSLPAYTSLLTGLYPSQHGVNESDRRLSPLAPTLPHALRREGYATACFSNNAWLSPTFGLGTGFDVFHTMWFSAQRELARKAEFLMSYAGGQIIGDVDKGARRTNARLLDWLDALDERPAFAFLAYVEPHTPYKPHRKIVRELAPPGFDGFEYETFEEYKWVLDFPDQAPLPERHQMEIDLRYDAEMRFIDGQLEALFGELEARGRLDNAIVIVTADHGEMLGEQDIYAHQFSVGEPLRRVPLVVWGPGVVGAAPVHHETVQTVDLAHALTGIVGAEWAPHEHTQALFDTERDVAVTEYPEPFMTSIRRIYPDANLRAIDRGLRCISRDRHKVVEIDGATYVGYDLRADPEERRPLDVEEVPELSSLADRLRAFVSDTDLYQTADADMPDEVKAHLRALGYIQ